MYLIHTIFTCSQKFILNIFYYILFTYLTISLYQDKLFASSGVENYTSGLCNNNSTSCINQVRFLKEETIQTQISDREALCQMIYHAKTDQVCSDDILKGESDPIDYYGKMNIKSYLMKSGYSGYTGFNVSFMDIKWERIYMRYKRNSERTPALCREFIVSKEIAKDLVLHFDCLWNLQIENQYYHFEYLAITPSGNSYIYKYLFFVPDSLTIESESVREWKAFLVMDISAVPNVLKLRLQTAPPSLNITTYKVEVLRTLQNNHTWTVQQTILYANESDSAGILKYTYNTKMKFGQYKFNVTPVHKDCIDNFICTVSTPEFLIVEMTEPKLLTGLVAMVILIPILLMLYFIWKRNCDTTEPTREPAGPPKFLMMYEPVSVEHINTMIELYKYFKKCHLHPMIDQFGIAESESKDPLRWYCDAFKEADFVGIFASPIVSKSEREQAQIYNKYSDTEVIAQNQLSYSLCSPGAKCKFFCISVPGSQWDTLPPQAQALKRFNLPRDLDPLLFLTGVAPQCDGGKGFLQTLEIARNAEFNFGCDSNKLTESVLRNNHNTPTIPDEEVGPSTASGLKDDDTSLCLDTAISGSDLLSSRQYLSDEMSTPPSSLDQFSLLGESN